MRPAGSLLKPKMAVIAPAIRVGTRGSETFAYRPGLLTVSVENARSAWVTVPLKRTVRVARSALSMVKWFAPSQLVTSFICCGVGPKRRMNSAVLSHLGSSENPVAAVES